MVFSLHYVHKHQIDNNEKNAGKLLAILIAMRMQRYNVGRIA
jgi:hypothetical protein